MKKYKKPNIQHKKISRKEAIQKLGITALTTSTLLFIQTKPASADSTNDVNETTLSTPSKRGRTHN